MLKHKNFKICRKGKNWIVGFPYNGAVNYYKYITRTELSRVAKEAIKMSQGMDDVEDGGFDVGVHDQVLADTMFVRIEGYLEEDGSPMKDTRENRLWLVANYTDLSQQMNLVCSHRVKFQQAEAAKLSENSEAG